jgi:GNAT superfamily N-acetyltransferase
VNSGLIELGFEHLDEVDALRVAIDWREGSWFLRPLLATGGAVLAKRGEDGRIEGMGATANFGTSGFICNMVTRPDLKRSGAGTAVFAGLLEWLADRGIERVQLEATEEGKGLYEKFGFASRWESVLGHTERQVEPGDESGIAPLGEGDWTDALALDRLATGTERGPFLRALVQAQFEKDVLRLVEGERLVAYGVRWEGRIGPIVAATATAGEKLARALASRMPGPAMAAIGHPMHAPMWERLGFEIEPLDVRMTYGPSTGDEHGMVVSMLNGAVG